MKKKFCTIFTVVAVMLFTACTKTIDRPASSASTINSKMYTNKPVNPIAITKKPIGYTGGIGTSDSTKTTTTIP